MGSFRNGLFTLGKHKFHERSFRGDRSGTVYFRGHHSSKGGKPFWRFFVYSTFTAPQFRDRSGTVYLLSGNINFARDASGAVFLLSDLAIFHPPRSTHYLLKKVFSDSKYHIYSTHFVPQFREASGAVYLLSDFAIFHPPRSTHYLLKKVFQNSKYPVYSTLFVPQFRDSSGGVSTLAT